jgi:MFS transporter, FHS family, glucose/mannose:H+ symporter
MATTLLGPLLPLLASRWALSDAAAGALFTAQFAGQLSSTTLSTVLTARLGEQRTLALGFALVAMGVAAVGVVPGSLGWLAVLTYGLGLGCVLPVTNILVAALAPARAASALSLVNVSWGIGAMVWPLVVTALTGVHPAGPTMLLAVASTAVGVTWLARPVIEGGGVRTDRSTATRPAPAVPARVVASYAALILLYVGSEIAISGWVAAFARRMATGQGAWAYAPTAFWSAQTAGRLLAPLMLRRVSESWLLVSSLVASVIAVLGLSTATSSVGGVIGAAALAGLGVAAIFPLLWAGVTREVAPSRPAAVGPLFAAGGVGGALLPWLVGVVSTGHGLGTGLLVPLAALALMLLLTVPGTVKNVKGPGTT